MLSQCTGGSQCFPSRLYREKALGWGTRLPIIVSLGRIHHTMKVSIIKVFDLLIKFRKLRICEHMILIEKVKENLSARKFSAGRGTRSSKMNVASGFQTFLLNQQIMWWTNESLSLRYQRRFWELYRLCIWAETKIEMENIFCIYADYTD